MLLMIDNYDSFTYNLVQYFGELGEDVRVFRNNKITIDQIESLPVYHPLSQLVYASSRHQVSDAWIAGRAKLRDGVLVDTDLPALSAKARRWGERIAGVRKQG